MINYYDGDIFESKADVICHQVNCQGAFGRGMAGQVKKMFPEVEKTYKIITKQWTEEAGGETKKLLGRVSAQPVEKGVSVPRLPMAPRRHSSANTAARSGNP